MLPVDPTTEADAALARAREIAGAVRAAGGRALIVGGWCRDRRLGRPCKDIDLEVFGLPAGDVRALLQRFGPVQTVGEAFTVYKLGSIDVALPRRESKTARGHRGFEVHGDPGMSFEEAARRRDFTINAIGFDPLREQWLDPFGGAADLEGRRLRAVDPRTFGEDSLRVLRAVQFVARFDLAVDAATAALCRGIPLDDLPAERIWGEIEKLLLQAPRPSASPPPWTCS
jgi:tRNA nucleotidyltransferase (CCA-adding enzyme)